VAAQPVATHQNQPTVTPAIRTPVSSAAVHRADPRRHRRAELPAFAAVVSGPLRPADLPASWRPGCPVAPAALRMVRLRYVGFDGRAHTGTIVVNEAVTGSVITVFRILYDDRFPIRRMSPIDAYHGSDPASMAADNTSGFNCRRAVAIGPPTWSMHAYGEAIDVNPVENPYFEPGVNGAQPPAGAAFANRNDHRPGMAYPGGVLVTAFTSVGWGWGGYWSGPDYQHFSVNGR
jgi:hypothetical protein